MLSIALSILWPKTSGPTLKHVTYNWFLIRGLVRGASHWGEFPDILAKAFPHSRLFFLDIPGNGRHWHRKSPLSVPAMTRFLQKEFHEILDRNPSENPRNLLLSVSLGGMVVLDWIQRDPKGIDGVVLINTSTRGLSSIFKRLRPVSYVKLLRGLISKSRVSRERAMLGVSSQKTERHEEVALKWAQIHEQQPVSSINGLKQIIAAARFHPEAPPPEVPALLISGGGDRLVHPDCSAQLQKEWGLELIKHPTAGHDLSLDAGEWLVDVLREWHHRIFNTTQPASPST